MLFTFLCLLFLFSWSCKLWWGEDGDAISTSLLKVNLNFCFSLSLFSVYCFFSVEVVNYDQERIEMPPPLLQICSLTNFFNHHISSFCIKKTGSIYILYPTLHKTSDLWEKKIVFSWHFFCRFFSFLLLFFFNRPVWSIRIWTIFRYLVKTNSHWWSDQQYWTWI